MFLTKQQYLPPLHPKKFICLLWMIKLIFILVVVAAALVLSFHTLPTQINPHPHCTVKINLNYQHPPVHMFVPLKTLAMVIHNTEEGEG